MYGENSEIRLGEASAGRPILDASYGIPEAPEAPEAPARGRLAWVAAVVGAVVLLGGGGFFALTAFGAAGGAESPEAAMDAMIEALDNGDFVTIGEMIEPSERRTIVEPVVTELLPELRRIGVLSDKLAEVDASNVTAIDWELSEVTYRVDRPVGHPDVAHVYLTGGQLTRGVNLDELPLADRIMDDYEPSESHSEDLADIETPFTFVEREGRWYFSGWFSLAEAVRLELGERLPGVEQAPTALGSESPDAAVEAMFAELVEFDLEGLVARTDPDEMAVLYRYSPLFLDDAQQALDDLDQELRNAGYRWAITDLELVSAVDGDDAVVTLNGFNLKVASADFDVSLAYGKEEMVVELDSESVSGSLTLSPTALSIEGVVAGEQVEVKATYDADERLFSASGVFGADTVDASVAFDPDGVCSEYSLVASDGTDEKGCLEDEMNSSQAACTFPTLSGPTPSGDWPTELRGAELHARRTDGQWYISPVGTTFAGLMSSLRSLHDDWFIDVEEALSDCLGTLDPRNLLIGDSFEDSLITDDMMIEGDSTELLEAEEAFRAAAEAAAAQATDRAGIDLSSEGDVSTFDLELGTVVEVPGSVDAWVYNSVFVELEAGDTLVATVMAQADQLDPTVAVYEVSGNIIGFNDDADLDLGLPDPLDSHIEVTVESAGTYQIRVASFNYVSGGEYLLTLERR